MPARTAILLPVIATLIFSGVAAASVQIRLQEEAELKTANYRLGDIAVVQVDGDIGLQRELSQLVVGKSPRPGYWGHVTRQQLGVSIDRALPGLYGRLVWSGAMKTRVKAGGIAFPGERIVEVAQAHLYSRLSAEHGQFSVGLLEPVADLQLPEGETILTARLPEVLQLGKRMAVPVDIALEGQAYQTVTAWFSVTVFAQVLTANRDLPALSPLQESVFKREYRDIAGLQGLPVTGSSALEGMRLKQPLAKGAALSASLLEPLPAVVKGQQVAVYATAGQVALKTTAVAMSDGDMLQRIQVRHVEDSINYPATVVGRGQVRVD
jgi:flagella basal body P-ring formation protein FlgA